MERATSYGIQKTFVLSGEIKGTINAPMETITLLETTDPRFVRRLARAINAECAANGFYSGFGVTPEMHCGQRKFFGHVKVIGGRLMARRHGARMAIAIRLNTLWTLPARITLTAMGTARFTLRAGHEILLLSRDSLECDFASGSHPYALPVLGKQEASAVA